MKKNYLLPLFFSITLNADQFSFILYNDFFVGTDKHFTNGVSLSWIDDKKYFDKYDLGVSLNQMIITPTDISKAQPQYDDIPYIGYSYISSYMFDIENDHFYEYRIELGVIGKNAKAQEVQNGFHKLIGSAKAKGWDTQLSTYYTINSLFRYGDISYKKHLKHHLKLDWFNHFGVQVGNFSDDIFAGTILRFGYNYLENFNLHYPYLKEQISLLNLNKIQKGFGWSISLGLNADFLFYSYIVNESQNEGYNIKKHNFNGSMYLGNDFYYNKHKITIFYDLQSPYSVGQDLINSFGGVIYNYQF